MPQGAVLGHVEVGAELEEGDAEGEDVVLGRQALLRQHLVGHVAGVAAKVRAGHRPLHALKKSTRSVSHFDPKK